MITSGYTHSIPASTGKQLNVSKRAFTLNIFYVLKVHKTDDYAKNIKKKTKHAAQRVP